MKNKENVNNIDNDILLENDEIEKKLESEILDDNNLDNSDCSKKISEYEEKLKAESERYLRLSADFANYKKRTDVEKADIYKYANEDLVKKLLPIIDDFDRALAHIENKEGVIEGIDLIITKLKTMLKNDGLEEIEALGADFDPNFHYAVAMEENSDFESQKVCEVLQKGYMLKSKVIRPAMVKVVK